MFLLDTNVISEFRRPKKADRNVIAWANTIPAASFFLSAISTVVTRNVTDFEPAGVALLNPWEPQQAG
jgi:predicted nucleic acid-binding protein